MPTTACIAHDTFPSAVGPADIETSDEMLVRLRRSNHALDKLRRELERGEIEAAALEAARLL